jgi:bifunctional non-homologous end joining protein LigD
VATRFDPKEIEGARRAPMPRWIEPMKATLTDDRFSDPDWVFEAKLDGERCIAFKDRDRVRLLSRNQKDIDVSYPEIADALKKQSTGRFILDGEIVAFDGDVPSFSKLQRRMHVSDRNKALLTGVEVFLYVFDVMYIDGYVLTATPLKQRRRALMGAVTVNDPIRVVDQVERDGESMYRDMCARPGWEGVIAKHAASAYARGRSKSWLKFKCSKEQEFVIGGFTAPQGQRERFGALLVGYYEGDRLRYAGKVGTGYGRKLLDLIGDELEARVRDTSPFEDKGLPRKDVTWVQPELVGQVGFSEWTGDGRLRHPRFLGLRRDKAAREVVREDA